MGQPVDLVMGLAAKVRLNAAAKSKKSELIAYTMNGKTVKWKGSQMRSEVENWVKKCFRDMGASEAQIAAEESKLQDDDEYLSSWAKTTGFKNGEQK
jgi:hypothetical protein